MKKLLASLLVLILPIMMFCTIAQAEVWTFGYYSAIDDEDVDGDETAQYEEKYTGSILALDTDAETILITSGDTEISREVLTGFEKIDDNTFLAITDLGNSYLFATTDGISMVATSVGQTNLFFIDTDILSAVN